MKKNVWIFLFAVLLPSVVLGWLALRSAEEQQIVFERRTAELYQKETDSLAVTVRDTVDAERRAFGETVHRLLARGDAEALARDFTNTLADAWEVKAVGFAINRDGKLASPSVASASKQPELQRFLIGNGSFLTSTEPAIVYNSAGDNNALRNPKNEYGKGRAFAGQAAGNAYANTANAAPASGNGTKDAAQAADGKTAGNEVVLLNDRGIGSGNSMMNLGNQPNDPAGLPGLKQIQPQAPMNLGTTIGPTETQTLMLNNIAQSVCQIIPNAGAFDFTGLVSAQPAQTLAAPLNGMPPPNIMPGSTTTLNFSSQGFGSVQRKEAAGSAPAPVVQPGLSAAPMDTGKKETPSSAAPSPTLAAGGGIADDPVQRRARELKLAEKESAKSGIAPAGKPGGLPLEVATMKMKSAQPTASDALQKAADAEKGDHLLRDAQASKAMPSAAPVPQETEDRPTLPKAEMLRAQPDPAGADKKRDVPAPMPPGAAAPAQAPLPMGPSSPASRVAEDQARNFPVAKAQAAPQGASRIFRKADAPAGARPADEAPAESPPLAKNALALNLANNVTRQVEPQQMLGQQSAAVSSIIPETAEFRSLTEEGDEGLVARFVQDKLNLIFWVRPPEAPEMIFGCLVEAAHFPDLWKDVLDRHAASSRGSRASLEPKPEFVLALLDDRGKPVATQPADADARDWKRPFVASEIGEALPHWEAALYLASPTALAESARGLWRTLAFTIAGAVALIAFGGWLVVADARRQLALAQQKTDFVSNVSHELKTPLTSIRMFAELMHDRPQPAEKQNQYLRIITVEAERLTRLINNVLDFAKIGRKQKRIEKKPLDLHALTARVWEGQEMHLRDAGFTTRWEAAPGPYPVLGDDDALAQVLVNLLSNAEKYSNGNKDVELHTWLDDGHVNVSVLDRGMGVPNGDDKKIFEAFYRAHDSLASGIQGSGLGLTLAQRIAHEHGGEIRFERREGGGCRFTLRVPLANAQESGIKDPGAEKSWSPDS